MYDYREYREPTLIEVTMTDSQNLLLITNQKQTHIKSIQKMTVGLEQA